MKQQLMLQNLKRTLQSEDVERLGDMLAGIKNLTDELLKERFKNSISTAKGKFESTQQFNNPEVAKYNKNIRDNSRNDPKLVLREAFMTHALFGIIFQKITKTVTKENAILLSAIINNTWNEVDTKIREIKERKDQIDPKIRQDNDSDYRRKRIKESDIVKAMETSFADMVSEISTLTENYESLLALNIIKFNQFDPSNNFKIDDIINRINAKAEKDGTQKDINLYFFRYLAESIGQRTSKPLDKESNRQFKNDIESMVQLYSEGNYSLDAIKRKLDKLEETLEPKPDIEELTLKYVETGSKSQSSGIQAVIGGSDRTAKQLNPSGDRDGARVQQSQIDDRSANRAQLNAGAIGNIQTASSGRTVPDTDGRVFVTTGGQPKGSTPDRVNGAGANDRLNGGQATAQLNASASSGEMVVKKFDFDTCRIGIEGSILSLVNKIKDENDQTLNGFLKGFVAYNNIFKLISETHSNKFDLYKASFDVVERVNELLSRIQFFVEGFKANPANNTKMSQYLIHEFAANTVLDLRSIDSTLANQIQAQLESLSKNSSNLTTSAPANVTKS